MASRAGAARELVMRYVSDARQFVTGADKATDALDKQEKEAERLARAVDKLDEAYSSAGRGAKRAAREAETSFDTVRDEANATARETLSSFDGSFESIVGGLQEVAAQAGLQMRNVTAGIALAAGAAGVGLLYGAWQRFLDAQHEANVRVDALIDKYRELGGVIDEQTAKEQAKQRIEEIGNGSYYEGRKRIAELADAARVSYELAAAIVTGTLTPAQRNELAVIEAQQRATERTETGMRGIASTITGELNPALVELNKLGGQTWDEAYAAWRVYYDDVTAGLDALVRKGQLAPGAARFERSELLAQSRYRP